MSGIRFQSVYKKYKDESVLEDINLVIPDGQFFALLGPSGCGKTTILRLIGGFEQVTSGTIHIDGEDVTHTPIYKRRVNTVFQNYALFPHLNVFENVAYSLSIQGRSKEDIEQRVMRMLKKVHLEKYAYKSISQLSGGQQQRVAIARAIINEPKVLLLDEPLAALDQQLKERLLVELIDLQDEIKTTFVYVTHDQSEALTVADQMAIMNADGAIEQIGTPKEVYEFPVSSVVADFVGTSNIFRGVLSVAQTITMLIPDLGSFEIQVDDTLPWVVDGREVVMSLRPEKIFISKRMVPGFANEARGKVVGIIYHGRSTEYILEINQHRIQVFEQNEEHFPKEQIHYDDQVYLFWHRDSAVIMER